MAYQCLDCFYQSQARFPSGRCPACDSYNIKKPGGIEQAEKEKEPKSLVQIFTLILFWSFLIWGIWDRYFNN